MNTGAGCPNSIGVGAMARSNFENLQVYQLSEQLADAVWDVVQKWSQLAQDTVGKQLIRAADSVGANIAGGSGRGSFQDNRRFARIARGSLYETKHWLRRAYRRRLVSQDAVDSLVPLVEELGPRLNAYLNSIGRGSGKQSKLPASRATDNGQLTTDTTTNVDD